MINLLQSNLIKANIKTDSPYDLIILDTVDSTNTYLENLSNQRQLLSPTFCLAETQTAGRGRPGKNATWYSPYAANIYLSGYWLIPQQTNIASLALVAAVALALCLEKAHITNFQIKWPNDFYDQQHRKFAGILVETTGLTNETAIVIGIGLNVKMGNVQIINQPWCDLATLNSNYPGRNYLAASLIQELITTMQQFQQTGAQSFLATWRRYDCLWQQPLIFRQHRRILSGIGNGIDDEGNYLVTLTNGQLVKLNSGVEYIRCIKNSS